MSLTMDSAIIPLSDEKKIYLETIDFAKPKAKLFDKKNRHIYKKLGYNGILIYTDEKDINSKYYCQITAFFKTENNNILKIIWNDNFIQQEQLNKLNTKIRTCFLEILNGETEVVDYKETLKLKANRKIDSLKLVNITMSLKRIGG